MAKSRRWRSQLTPPPPPYEANQLRMDSSTRSSTSGHHSPIAENYAHSNQHHHQTIPKTALSGQNGNMMMSRNDKRLRTNNNSKTDHSRQRQQVKKYNNQNRPHLPCAHDQANSRRKHSLSSTLPHRNSTGQEQFVRTLTAPSSFSGYMSVEPLAFLAIVALYIEFPAIQDLIWTKICLDVIAKHDNFSQYAQFSSNQNRLHPSLASNDSTSAAGSAVANSKTSSPLPADERIQEASVAKTVTHQVIVPHGNSYDPSRKQHSLCDRLNKQAVPSDIRQEILNVDSLFWLKYQILICSLGLLASPYWGGLSDKIGRLIPMNAPIVSAILCNAISLTFGLLISLDSHILFHIEWLYLGAIIVGLSGGQAVLIMNMYSFLSDNTTNEERSRRVTFLESVIFVAHSLGFFLSHKIMLLGLDPADKPWLNRHFVAFSACVVLNAICIIYSLAKLRHRKFHRFLNNFEREQQEAAILGSSDQIGGGSSSTLNREHADTNAAELMSSTQLAGGERLRELTSSTPDDPDGPIARSDKSNWSFRHSMITFRYYRETYEIATKRRDTRRIILLLLLSGFISALSLATLMSLLFIYVRMDPFNWNTDQYSMWNSISATTRGVALVTLTLLMRFWSTWNVPDPIIAALGFLGKGAGLLLIGLAQSSSYLNWSLVAFTFSEYSMPPIRSLLSKLVVREELCKIYSCLGALQSLCFILGNLAFYAAFTLYTDQNLFRTSFLVVAGIEFCAVILVLIIYTSIRREIPQILL